jgi:hypothetical protein
MIQDVADLERIRRAVIGLAIILAIPVVAWIAGKWIVAGDVNTPVSAVLAAVIAVISINILNDWRFGVYLSIAWLLSEDLARKYLGNNMAIYFGKDFLIGVTYVSFLFAAKRNRFFFFRPPFLLPMSLFFWLGIAQIFNPNSPSFFYGFMGAKLYFYYIPLMFVGYALLRSEEDLRRLLVWNLVLAGVISLIGIIQAIIGPDFMNPATLAPEIAGLSRLYREAPISGLRLLRPNSVFVSDGRFSSFLLLMWILGLGSTAYLVARIQRGRRYVLLAVALVAGGILLSGSRSAFAYGVISTVVLGAAFTQGGQTSQRAGLRKVVKAVRRLAILVAIALFILAFLFPTDVGSRWAFYSETLSPESPAYEVSRRAWDYPVGELIKAFDDPNWVYGNGIGTASLGVNYVALVLGKPLPGIAVESGLGAMVLELGVLGPILWLIFAVSVVYSLWKVVRRLVGTPLYPLGFSIFWFATLLLLPFTYGSLTSYQNYVLNAYLWLLIGILFRLPDLAAPYLAASPVQWRPAGR